VSGERTRDKLRRLRREGAPKRPPPLEAAAAEALAPEVAEANESSERGRSGVRRSVRDRLGRRGKRVLAAPVSAPCSKDGAGLTVGPPARLSIGPALGPAPLGPRQAAGGAVRARTTDDAANGAHGSWTFDEVDAADPSTFALLTGDAALAGLDLRDVVYLDTETSGLAGGVGTWVFLVGLGRFVQPRGSGPARFEVWQGFLADPEDERALLAETAARIRDASAVVSFFGKSFDRHRLEDKMRLCGVEPPFEGRPHLDLFHPLRSLYRNAFDDTRLATMERELCGFERTDDLPGAFAPAAWFDFLGGRAHRLEGVFEHNLHDVRSLVTLAAHLGRATSETRADGRDLAGPSAERAAGVGRALWKVGRRTEALGWIERARERRDSRALRLQHAEALRLTKAVDAASRAYETLVREPEDAATARCWSELAKLHEHGRKDPDQALECCRRSRAALERTLTGYARARLLRELGQREERLVKKLGARMDG